MNQVEAIYENGTLRLLTPLPLEEGQRVRVFVTPVFSQKADPWERVKERLEETGKKFGMIGDRAAATADEPAASV
jgi:predicted DNA-binding antitoxin AbrB/MazE fold protein